MCSRFLRSPPILFVVMLLMVAMVLPLMNSSTIPRTTTSSYTEEAVYVQASESPMNYDQNVVYVYAIMTQIENENPFNQLAGLAQMTQNAAAGSLNDALWSGMSYLMMVTYGPVGGRANAILDAYPNPFISYPNPFNQTV